MRVVGYVRETPGVEGRESSFAQSERIRRWAARGGHAVAAVCQDLAQPGYAIGREGYRSLLGILEAGEATTVVLPGLSALSDDKIIQEILLWDLRERGASVILTEPGDRELLAEPSADPARLLVRDVLARMTEHLGGRTKPAAKAPAPESGAQEVLLEVIPAEERPSS